MQSHDVSKFETRISLSVELRIGILQNEGAILGDISESQRIHVNR